MNCRHCPLFCALVGSNKPAPTWASCRATLMSAQQSTRAASKVLARRRQRQQQDGLPAAATRTHEHGGRPRRGLHASRCPRAFMAVQTSAASSPSHRSLPVSAASCCPLPSTNLCRPMPCLRRCLASFPPAFPSLILNSRESRQRTILLSITILHRPAEQLDTAEGTQSACSVVVQS